MCSYRYLTRSDQTRYLGDLFPGCQLCGSRYLTFQSVQCNEMLTCQNVIQKWDMQFASIFCPSTKNSDILLSKFRQILRENCVNKQQIRPACQYRCGIVCTILVKDLQNCQYMNSCTVFSKIFAYFCQQFVSSKFFVFLASKYIDKNQGSVWKSGALVRLF